MNRDMKLNLFVADGQFHGLPKSVKKDEFR